MARFYWLVLGSMFSLVAVGQVNLPSPFQIDGSVSISESRDKDVMPVRHRDQFVTIRENDEWIYLAVQSNMLTIFNAYIVDENQVKVLHASAALGEVTFSGEADAMKPNVSAFDWIYRDPNFWDEKHENGTDSLAEFLARFGWTSNTVSMGSEREMEMVISKQKLGSQAKLLVSYSRKDGDKRGVVFGPEPDATLTGDKEADTKLHNGEVPKTLSVKVGRE